MDALSHTRVYTVHRAAVPKRGGKRERTHEVRPARADAVRKDGLDAQRVLPLAPEAREDDGVRVEERERGAEAVDVVAHVELQPEEEALDARRALRDVEQLPGEVGLEPQRAHGEPERGRAPQRRGGPAGVRGLREGDGGVEQRRADAVPGARDQQKAVAASADACAQGEAVVGEVVADGPFGRGEVAEAEDLFDELLGERARRHVEEEGGMCKSGTSHGGPGGGHVARKRCSKFTMTLSVKLKPNTCWRTGHGKET